MEHYRPTARYHIQVGPTTGWDKLLQTVACSGPLSVIFLLVIAGSLRKLEQQMFKALNEQITTYKLNTFIGVHDTCTDVSSILYH